MALNSPITVPIGWFSIIWSEEVELRSVGAGSVISILYDFVSVTVDPPAVVPVIETEKFIDPDIKGIPLITPVIELIDNPGGNPEAEKVPLPECSTMKDGIGLLFMP